MDSSIKNLRTEVAKIFAESGALSANDYAALQILASYDGISYEDLDELTGSVKADFFKMEKLVVSYLLSGKPALQLIQKVAQSLSVSDNLLKDIFTKTEKQIRSSAQKLAKGKDDNYIPDEYKDLAAAKFHFSKEEMERLDEQ